MKILSLVLGFCLLATCAFADVTAEIIGKDIDNNGNIVIRTQYKIDGVEVESRYPPDAQGRYYWQTRYNIVSFAGMNITQIKQRVGKDLKAFAENLIRNEYLRIANSGLNINATIGQKLTVQSASIYVDTDQDNIPDKEWIVKNDGTKTEIPYIPPAIP